MKRLISTFMIIALSVSFFASGTYRIAKAEKLTEDTTENNETVFIDTMIFEGEGTEISPYTISTEEDLLRFSNTINNTELNQDYNNKFYQLSSDLDISHIDNWVPIAKNQARGFRGIFNGNGHSIKGLQINENLTDYDSDQGSSYFGLFGFTSGTIKNLSIVDAEIRITTEIPPSEDNFIYNCVGGIIGSSHGILTDLFFSGSINVVVNDSYRMTVGGIAGELSSGGVLSNAKSSGDISIKAFFEAPYGSLGGGLVGQNTGKIENSTNHASLKSVGYSVTLGGIAASSFSDIDNVINYGDISGENWSDSIIYFGGVVGTQYSGDTIATLRKAVNTGNIWSNSGSGGVIGTAQPSYIKGSVVLTELTNTGAVKGEITGGIIGSMSERISLKKAFNRGSILGRIISGGIVGTTEKDNIEDVYNMGYVEGTESVGGIAGSIQNLVYPMNSAYNYGEVKLSEVYSTSFRVGGIAGGIGRYLNISDSLYYLDHTEKAFGSYSSAYSAPRKTEDEMKRKETYQGFDFENTWMMMVGFPYPPVLKSLYIPLSKMELYQDYLVTGQEMNVLKPEPVSATIVEGYYTSSDESVLSIDSAGNVKANLVGYSYILGRPYDLDQSFTHKIEVKQGVTEIKVTENVSIEVDEEMILNLEILPMNSVDKSIVWKSLNERIVSVDQNGTITGNKPGQAEILISALDGSGTTATISVDVIKPVEGVNIEAEVVEIFVGEQLKISYSILPEDATNKIVNWSSSDESIVYVNENEELVSVGAGKAEIIVLTENGSFRDTLQVHSFNRIEGIRILNKITHLGIGTSILLSAEIYPINTKDTGVNWASSDSSVASVDQYGRLTGVGSGEALITVSTPRMDHIDHFLLEVGDSVDSIIIIGPDVVRIFEETEYSADVMPSTAISKKVLWRIRPDSGDGSIDEHGIFRATEVGEAVIIVEATDGSGVFSEKRVTILPVEPSVENVSSTIIPMGSILNDSTLTGSFIDTQTKKKVEGELHWTDGSQIVIETSGSYEWTFIPNSDTYSIVKGRINAIDIAGYTVNLFSVPDAVGEVIGAGVFKKNETITVQAKSLSGYRFIHWTEDDEIVSTESEYSFAVTKNRNLTADFEIENDNTTLLYRTHVQSYGWQDFVSDGMLSGTTGKA